MLLVQHLGHLGVSLYWLFFVLTMDHMSHFFSWLWISFSCSSHSCNFFFCCCIIDNGWVIRCRDSRFCFPSLKSVVFVPAGNSSWHNSNSISYGGQQLKALLISYIFLAVCFLPGTFLPESLLQICSLGISQGLVSIYIQIWGLPLLWFPSFCDVPPHFPVFPEALNSALFLKPISL